MSDFDKAFAPADVSFAKRAGKPAVLYNLGLSAGTDITVVEDAGGEQSSSFRAGGKVANVSIEFETDAVPVRAIGVSVIGWKIFFEDEHYRILSIRPQGGTFTLVCGPLADATPDAW